MLQYKKNHSNLKSYQLNFSYKIIMEHNYWRILLKSTKYQGLTIPNIIGFKSYLPEKYKLDTIEILFSKILDDDSVDVLVLKYCSDIGEYVFSFKNPYYPIKGNTIKNQKTNNDKLILAPNVEILGKTLPTIIEKLKKKYNEKIKKELFSFNRKTGEFEKFNQKEIDDMRNITIANNVYKT